MRISLSHWKTEIVFLFSAPSHSIFPGSHEFLNLVRDQPVHPEETVKEQNRQKQNSQQICSAEFFQETSTDGSGNELQEVMLAWWEVGERALKPARESFPFRKDRDGEGLDLGC